MLHCVTLILTVGSPAIYANMVSAPPGSKRGCHVAVGSPGVMDAYHDGYADGRAIIARLSRFRPFRWLMKAVVAVVMLSVLGIAVLLGLLLLDHNRDTTLPTPTGPFAVGRATRAWSNAAQADPLAPQPGTKQELIAWIWYPASASRPSQTVDDYMPAPWRTAMEGGVLPARFFSRDLSRVHVHSIRDADVSSQQSTYPVVLLRPGGAAPTMDYTSLAEDLASHGYVVVGFDAPYRSGSSFSRTEG